MGIYAGAQKNVGPAGNTVVIVREDLLGKALPECPTYLDWKVQADGASMYNTPACYPIYMMGLYLKYMKKIGGIPALQKLTEERSKLLYESIESSNGFYHAPVDSNCRSRVNVPFVIKGDDAALTKKFLSATAAEGLAALAGHRSVGGCRASLYNAMPLEGVARLVKFMKIPRRKCMKCENLHFVVQGLCHSIVDTAFVPEWLSNISCCNFV